MPKYLDRVFQALSDPTRRRVVERLSRGAASFGDLAKRFAMAPPSVLQHLRVLEACKLIRSRKQGRVRVYHVSPARLRSAERWMEQQREFWERRLKQLDEYLYRLKEMKR